jgi:hypothetical protein
MQRRQFSAEVPILSYQRLQVARRPALTRRGSRGIDVDVGESKIRVLVIGSVGSKRGWVMPLKHGMRHHLGVGW